MATTSCLVTGQSPTVRDVGRPKTGETPIQRLRMSAIKWARLRKAAASEGKTRTKVIDELVDWYLRDRPTSQLTRPERVELTPEEAAAAERRGPAPDPTAEQQERTP